MPDRFEAICPTCGPVKVWPGNITIETIRKWYSFVCPECFGEVGNDAAPTDLIRLVRGGAHEQPGSKEPDARA